MAAAQHLEARGYDIGAAEVYLIAANRHQRHCNNLARAYPKLGISSRGELRELLRSNRNSVT